MPCVENKEALGYAASFVFWVRQGGYVSKATVITKATVVSLVAKAVMITVMVKQKRGSNQLPLFLLIGLSCVIEVIKQH